MLSLLSLKLVDNLPIRILDVYQKSQLLISESPQGTSTTIASINEVMEILFILNIIFDLGYFGSTFL